MKLRDGLHLAYCTNVHRGETWDETFAALERHVLPVRRRVAPNQPYAIGLRLSRRAAAELADSARRDAFRRWLDREDCYVFTVNGFPYGSFHGTRVKEQVYAPDWSTPERLAYTQQLFELLDALAPAGEPVSVSTVPASYKAFVAAQPERRAAIFRHLTACGQFLERLAERSGRDVHLGLEPEPLCLFETSTETVAFFQAWRDSDRSVEPLFSRIGVNYDCCHLAVEFESPAAALDRLHAAGLRLSKLHLSSALRVRPDEAARGALAAFVEPVYLHQVVAAVDGVVRRRYADLPDALAEAPPPERGEEWRIHFHVPLHSAPGEPFADTRDHLLGALDWLAAHPDACAHLEMETYTWEVLPRALQLPIEEQIVREYDWTLAACRARGLASAEAPGHSAAAPEARA